ncbi:MAG: hypothetical protein ABI697_10840 [Devosia sp.]
MAERDDIFRERLIAMVGAMHDAEGRDPKLRRTIGMYATRLFKEAGARDWGDLKQRADGATYDSLLQLFQTQSDAAEKSGDKAAVRAFEVLAVSLIARRQYQEDLIAGVQFLDKFIDLCVTVARRAGAQFIPLKRSRPGPR